MSLHMHDSCQWPGCSYVAKVRIRRGERMEDMRVCTPHAADFHDLSNADALTISNARQPRRRVFDFSPRPEGRAAA